MLAGGRAAGKSFRTRWSRLLLRAGENCLEARKVPQLCMTTTFPELACCAYSGQDDCCFSPNEMRCKT